MKRRRFERVGVKVQHVLPVPLFLLGCPEGRTIEKSPAILVYLPLLQPLHVQARSSRVEAGIPLVLQDEISSCPGVSDHVATIIMAKIFVIRTCL
jgi:hypothetical protein